HVSRIDILRCGEGIRWEEHANQFVGNPNDCRCCHVNGNPRIQALFQTGPSCLLHTHPCHSQHGQSGGSNTPASIRPETRATFSPAPAGKSPITLPTTKTSTTA